MKDKSGYLHSVFANHHLYPQGKKGFWNKDHGVLAFGICSSSHVFYLTECERVIMLRMERIQLKPQCSAFNVQPTSVLICLMLSFVLHVRLREDSSSLS